MFSFLYKFLDRIIAAIFALVALQFPQFIYQYLCHLEGHYFELHRHIMQLQLAAEKCGKTLPQYIEKFVSSLDPVFHSQGEIMQALSVRYRDLELSYQALQQTSLLLRPLIFLQHLQIDIAKETMHQFQYGIALNIESAIYALLGIFIGSLCFEMCSKPFLSLYVALKRKHIAFFKAVKPIKDFVILFFLFANG